ncbi:MAG: PHP domain-containing protein [Actinomycetota bacterium]|nr:PHP domain-containing protein [Actinomycetota bacterium]
MNTRVALDEDFHVHSTFSDGASTLAENVRAARERGLRTLCLVDHVRRDTSWVPDFTDAVDQHRYQPGLRVLAGVEAKILDTSGQLDVPPDLAGIDLLLIADHQFPAEGGPVRPDEVRAALGRGAMTAAEAIERLCEATANSLSSGFRPLLAHLFSVLPKIGLTEAMVPDSLLTHLAKRVAHAGAMIEVNEKWSCPSTRTVTVMAGAGVWLVAGSDSHHCRDIGVYDSVRRTVSAGA